jgi:hypothetical protein
MKKFTEKQPRYATAGFIYDINSPKVASILREYALAKISGLTGQEAADILSIPYSTLHGWAQQFPVGKIPFSDGEKAQLAKAWLKMVHDKNMPYGRAAQRLGLTRYALMRWKAAFLDMRPSSEELKSSIDTLYMPEHVANPETKDRPDNGTSADTWTEPSLLMPNVPKIADPTTKVKFGRIALIVKTDQSIEKMAKIFAEQASTFFPDDEVLVLEATAEELHLVPKEAT